MDVKEKIKEYLRNKDIILDHYVSEDTLRSVVDLILIVFSSQRNFCFFYEIHQPNFSAWYTGKRKSNPQARNAILSFLNDPPSQEEIDISNNKRAVSIKSITNHHSTKVNYDEPSRSNSNTTMFADYSKFDAYCFIDGDNNIQAIYSLIDIPVDYNRVKIYSFHAASFGNTKQHAELKRLAPWLHMEFDTSLQVQEVADYLLCIRVFRLLESLTRTNDPRELKTKILYLVSADKFINIVAKRIELEYVDYNHSIHVKTINCQKQRSLAWELHKQGLSKHGFDIEQSQFHRACKRITDNQPVDKAAIVDRLNNVWTAIESTNNQYQVLPFTVSNVIHCVLEKQKISDTNRTVDEGDEHILSLLKMLRDYLDKVPQREASISEIQKTNFPSTIKQYGGWKEFLEKNKSLCAKAGIVTDENSKVRLLRFSSMGLFAGEEMLNRANPEKLIFVEEAQQIRHLIQKLGLKQFRKLTRQLEQEEAHSSGRINTKGEDDEAGEGHSFVIHKNDGTDNVVLKLSPLKINTM